MWSYFMVKLMMPAEAARAYLSMLAFRDVRNGGGNVA